MFSLGNVCAALSWESLLTELSFDLVNEPPSPKPEGMTRSDHERVVRAAVQAIREEDAERLIIADGLGYGRIPSPELNDCGIAQSCRAYEPMGISHYKASWVKGEDWPLPVWPGAWHYGGSWGQAELDTGIPALDRSGVAGDRRPLW